MLAIFMPVFAAPVILALGAALALIVSSRLGLAALAVLGARVPRGVMGVGHLGLA